MNANMEFNEITIPRSQRINTLTEDDEKKLNRNNKTRTKCFMSLNINVLCKVAQLESPKF